MKNKYANDVTYLNGSRLESAPAELQFISEEWTKRANAYGDSGSCVLGAGFLFKFRRQWFFLPPLCRWQGSISWEHCYEDIQYMLIDIGATDISYDWGNMD